jgi:hypothetical protein
LEVDFPHARGALAIRRFGTRQGKPFDETRYYISYEAKTKDPGMVPFSKGGQKIFQELETNNHSLSPLRHR